MNTPDPSTPLHRALLVVPRIFVQNANCISSPLTWGFPAITAFAGLMTALERRLGRAAGIALYGVGVICHRFEAQVSSAGYSRAFHLTRNPVLPDGSTAAIVEEGRAHLDVTLVFDAQLSDANRGSSERATLAARVANELEGMRIAGGSVMPSLASTQRRPDGPSLHLMPDDSHADEQRRQFRRLARKWLPGFALVSRDDVLQERLFTLRRNNPSATVLDAWLDLSRWNARAGHRMAEHIAKDSSTVEWVTDHRLGWTVPLPVGFTALSELYAPGCVRGARDSRTPFRFVETVWSIGQWVSPNRLQDVSELVWSIDNDSDPAQPAENTLYRCVNGYKAKGPKTELTE